MTGSLGTVFPALACAAMAAILAVDLASAQDAALPASPGSDVESIFEPEPVVGTQRALIICGLSGDPEHHASFADVVKQLGGAFTGRLGVDPKDLIVLFGDEPADSDDALIRDSARATREELTAAVAKIRESLAPADTLWVIVLGHSHFDGKHSWLNLPGPDIHQTDFAKLFEGLTSQRQVFLITTPTSGQYVKPLSAANRVVISATESDWETNETEFPGVLATLLTTPPAAQELDADRDGRLTLFDLYVTTCRTLAQAYYDRQFLATEHPQLDDNGDGRATELQIDYLSEDLGGRVRRGRLAPPVVAAGTDGFVAKSILLPLEPVAPPAAPSSTESPGATDSPAPTSSDPLP